MAYKMVWLSLLGLSTAQTTTESSADQTISAPAAFNGSTAPNPTAPVVQLNLNLEDVWDLLVGPVVVAETTTVYEPSPVPSSLLIPPPPISYSPFPSGQQVPLVPKNESWSFPEHFWWGVAGAAFQIEGAAKDEGRGPSVWDALSRVTNHIVDNSTADVADNNYYLYKEDISRLAAQRVKIYSFSLSWSRILPFGRGPVNQLAIDHYNDLIDTCIEYGVEPSITLYHWDTPLILQDTYGGWLSEDIVPDFVEYARIAFEAFGDRVEKWYTVNEPIVFCNQYPLPAQYFKNFTIPNKEQPFHCGQSVLLAHSKAYRVGKSILGDNSSITYKNNGGYKIPLTNSSADAKAVQRAWDFNEGWFSEPVYLTGDYPATVKEYVSGFLRDFTDEEKQEIVGSADFYAHDAYSAQFYMAPKSGLDSCIGNETHPLYPTCADSTYFYSSEDGGWVVGSAADPGSPWLHKATDWVPAFLKYMQDTWVTPSPGPAKGVAVTEFGFSEPFESSKTLLQDILYDTIRASYYHDYMEAVLMAIAEGTDVIGSLAWSFVDNYEWQQGYKSRFGIQYVNFTDPSFPRYYKASFFEYINVFKVYGGYDRDG